MIRQLRVLTGALILLALILHNAPAVAQSQGFAEKGVTEIGGSASFSSISEVYQGKTGSATTVFSLGPRIGYFVADGFEIGFNPGISSFLFPQGLTVWSGAGSSSTTLLQLFVFPAYNIRNEGSKIYPFIEVPLGYTSQSSGSGSGSSGFSWGVRGGVKVTPVGGLLLTFSGEYYQITLNRTGDNERAGFNYFSFGVGIGGFF
jgi:hypothetical protein